MAKSKCEDLKVLLVFLIFLAYAASPFLLIFGTIHYFEAVREQNYFGWRATVISEINCRNFETTVCVYKVYVHEGNFANECQVSTINKQLTINSTIYIDPYTARSPNCEIYNCKSACNTNRGLILLYIATACLSFAILGTLVIYLTNKCNREKTNSSDDPPPYSQVEFSENV